MVPELQVLIACVALVAVVIVYFAKRTKPRTSLRFALETILFVVGLSAGAVAVLILIGPAFLGLRSDSINLQHPIVRSPAGSPTPSATIEPRAAPAVSDTRTPSPTHQTPALPPPKAIPLEPGSYYVDLRNDTEFTITYSCASKHRGPFFLAPRELRTHSWTNLSLARIHFVGSNPAAHANKPDWPLPLARFIPGESVHPSIGGFVPVLYCFVESSPGQITLRQEGE